MGKEKPPQFKECCEDFFKANSLQNIYNDPLRHCAYCGHKLTHKQFAYANTHWPLKKWVQVRDEKTYCRTELRKFRGKP